MESELYEALSILKDLIEKDERVKALKIADNALNNDEIAKKLAKDKDDAFQKLLELKKKSDKNEADYINAKQDFDKINAKFNELESVKNYKIAYGEVAKLYQKIDHELFAKFREKEK